MVISVKPRYRNERSMTRKRNDLFLSKGNFKHVGHPKETLFIGAGRFHGLRCIEGGRKSIQFVREALNLTKADIKVVTVWALWRAATSLT